MDQLLNEIKSRITSVVAFANEQLCCDKEDACGVISSLSESVNITIIVLSKVLDTAPHIYLDTVCSCALSLVNLELSQGNARIVKRWQVGIFVASLLQLMSFSSPLTSKRLLKGGAPQILLAYRTMQRNVAIHSKSDCGCIAEGINTVSYTHLTLPTKA